MADLPLIPLSLYIHLPWCVQKCPYCDFNSHTLKQPLPEALYIQALIEDLEGSLGYIQERPIHSIFIGGGTPSLFSPRAIHQLLQKIQERVVFKPGIEITLEANPGTVEQTRFLGFLQSGINRLSLGIQSFHDAHLKKLRRIHGAFEARKAIEAAILAGFKRINLDIMYGLPGQTTQEALVDIEMAVQFQPEHISWYQLTLEPNTPFYHHPPTLPEDETCWTMLKNGQAYLENNGYLQYEVSAYTKKSAFCQHNLNYWEFGDYLGIGAGACSKITNLRDRSIQRSMKKKHPKHYIDASPDFMDHEKKVPTTDLPLEFMMNALRLNKTLNISLFEQRTGLSISSIQKPLEQAYQSGWLTYNSSTIQLTRLGYLFLNDVVEVFFPKSTMTLNG